jgi:hypothetical protein
MKTTLSTIVVTLALACSCARIGHAQEFSKQETNENFIRLFLYDTDCAPLSARTRGDGGGHAARDDD